MKPKDTDFDIAIIGCGPVGAIAANFLARDGAKVIVIEERPDCYPLPRAVHLDHEMIRVFQDIGLLDAILPLMRETEGHLHLGADGDVIRYMSSKGMPKKYGWANDYFFYQPELEAELRKGFERFANIIFKTGIRVENISQSQDVVNLTLADGTKVCAKYAIACDGSRSMVRKTLGIGLEDLQFEEDWLVVDVEVTGDIKFPPIASLPLGANLQQLSVMRCDPIRPMTIVPGRGNHRRWEIMLLPNENRETAATEENVAQILAPWLEDIDHKIIRRATYTFHGLIAKEWQKGRIFLAGDAAHQTPPFFGQGMCHGVRDISNLCFKLNLVLQNKANPALLTSYQSEREPHVRAVIGAAVAAGKYICELDVQKAQKRDAELREKQKSGKDIATASELIPPYKSGFVMEGFGARSYNPEIVKAGQNGKTDDFSGTGFICLSEKPLNLDDEARVIADKIGLKTMILEDFSDNEGKDLLVEQFAKNDCDVLIIRPDHYIYGGANGGEGANILLKSLNNSLQNEGKYETLNA